MPWFHKSQRPIAPVTNPAPQPPAARTGVGAQLRRWLRNDRPPPVAQGGPLEPLRVSQGGQPFPLTIAKPPALIEADSDSDIESEGEGENVEAPAARVASEMESGNLTDAQVIERLNDLTNMGGNRVASFLPGNLRQALATSPLSPSVLRAAEELFDSCMNGSQWGVRSDCELILDLAATVKFPDHRVKAERAFSATLFFIGGAADFKFESIVNVFKAGCFGEDAIQTAVNLATSKRAFTFALFAELIIAGAVKSEDLNAHFIKAGRIHFVRDFFRSDEWNSRMDHQDGHGEFDKLKAVATNPETSLSWWASPHGIGEMSEGELMAAMPPPAATDEI